MNPTCHLIEFFSRSARSVVYWGSVFALVGLHTAVAAAGLPGAVIESNAVAPATNVVVAADSAANTPQPVTHALTAAPMTTAPGAAAVTNGLVSAPITNAPGAAALTNAVESASIANIAPTATNQTETGATNVQIALDDRYRLAIGDRVSFRILEDEDEPKPLIVADSGDLEVPYIGRVPAENKTCRQLAAEVKAALEKDYYYHAAVIIAVDLMTKSHGRVYLVGAVRLPGPVELPTDEALTLSRAILRAGGFTDYADRKHVKVTRMDAPVKDTAGPLDNGTTVKETTGQRDNGTATKVAGTEDKKEFTVDVGEIFDKGRIEKDVLLESGDLIYVPDRLIRF